MLARNKDMVNNSATTIWGFSSALRNTVNIREIMVPVRLLLRFTVMVMTILGCAQPYKYPYTIDYPGAYIHPIGTPSIVDGRERFREIFCELMESKREIQSPYIECEDYLWRLNDEPLPAAVRTPLPAHDTRLRILIVLGAFSDCIPEIGKPYKLGTERLIRLGYRIDYVPVSGRSGSDINAAVIAKTVADLDIQASERLLLIGYSKGTTDILHFLVNYPDLARKVAAVLSVAGVVNGSVIADKYAKTYHKWFEDLSLGACWPGDGGVLESLTREEQFRWLALHPLPKTVQYYSIAAFAREENIQAGLRLAYELLEPIDPLHDGQLLIYDQLIPGSTLMAYVNADHWTVAVPVDESFSGRDPDSVARNKKLRTLLFEAMILFVAERLQQTPVPDSAALPQTN